MASNILVIAEFGAQKQRIHFNSNCSYKDMCEQIYSLFKLDFNKSKYVLQQQDLFKTGVYTNFDEFSFVNDLKYYSTNNIGDPIIRIRLVPESSKNSSKTINGHRNGGKNLSTSSIYQHDESDRASTTSITTIDLKKLIKTCLKNLKETTENIQLLDRYLNPEDYVDDNECQLIDKFSSNTQQSSNINNNEINRQISQTSSTSDMCLSSSNRIYELIPAPNNLINIGQPPSPLSINKPVLSSVKGFETSMNPPTETSILSTTNIPSRSLNKSFSNRLGTILPTNQNQRPIISQEKLVPSSPSLSSSPHQVASPKLKSPIKIEQSPTVQNEKTIENESCLNEILPASIPKCKIELMQFQTGYIVEGTVSVASNASYFFLQLIDQTKEDFDRLSKRLHDYYSNLDKNTYYRPLPGDFCVAMYTEDARWYRARIIRYTSDQTCEVFYIDYGNMEELSIDLVHEILPDFTRISARAIACTIGEILPPIGQEGWTKRATFAFASRCSNERVQAVILDSAKIGWPMHFVQLRVVKTQEDIGAVLESCKLARHVSNNEISTFWSNKIRIEQYILYNLQDPTPNRFPFTEQVQDKSTTEDNTNTFLSSAFQPSTSSTNNTLNEQSTIHYENNKSNNNSNKSPSTSVSEENNEQHSKNEIVEEKRNEIISSTPSSSLNPEATPFVALSTIHNESTRTTSTSDESDDEYESNETSTVTSDLSEHLHMPIKEEVIVDMNLMPSTPLLKSWLPVEVSHIETPTRFYIRYIYGPGWNLGNGETPDLLETKDLPVKNAVLKELTNEMTECYRKHKRVYSSSNYDEGELVAVKYRSQWHRGRFIQYKPNIDFAIIFFVDYGYTRSVPIQMIRPINNRFVLHPEQAHLVHLHQPGQSRSHIEWTKTAMDEFREMSKDNTCLYARIINEPNTIDLMSYDQLTKKWFSFYEHFVKHLSNIDEIEQDN